MKSISIALCFGKFFVPKRLYERNMLRREPIVTSDWIADAVNNRLGSLKAICVGPLDDNDANIQRVLIDGISIDLRYKKRVCRKRPRAFIANRY
jgi:hypothetical protein